MTEFKIPKGGEKIEVDSHGTLRVPDRPVIPFIEGDGTGPDIWRAAQRVLDAWRLEDSVCGQAAPLSLGYFLGPAR